MPRLILIKHAAPTVVPGVAPELWSLSDAGRASIPRLADAIRPFAPVRVVSSDEAKAVETGKLLTEALSIPFQIGEGLHEHDRSNVPQLRSSEFISMIELMFRKPQELILGRETAAQALERIENSITAVHASHPNDSLAIITHGTVLALFLAARSGKAAFDLWRAMQLPSFAVVSFETDGVEQIVERV